MECNWRERPTPTGGTIRTLPVPGHAQPDDEAECLVYSIYMVLQYLESNHPDSDVRSGVAGLSIPGVRDQLTIRESGWIPDQSDLDELTQDMPAIELRHKDWERLTTPSQLYRSIEEGLQDCLPTIPILDGYRLRNQDIPEPYPMHSVVVTGLRERTVAINDPWGVMYDIVDSRDLADAWEVYPYQLITIEMTKNKHSQAGLDEYSAGSGQ